MDGRGAGVNDRDSAAARVWFLARAPVLGLGARSSSAFGLLFDDPRFAGDRVARLVEVVRHVLNSSGPARQRSRAADVGEPIEFALESDGATPGHHERGIPSRSAGIQR